MSQELLYTSAPFGLKPGSRGFCTVLSTQGMPAPLATALESLSGYRPAYPPSDARSHLNPVVTSHLKVQAAGRSWHVLSRIADYGLDYSQRPNKLAHHVVLDPGELVEAGPADLLNAPSFMRTEWHEEPRLVPAKAVKKLGSPQRVICQAWKDMTGDAGWAGVIAESFLRDLERPIFLIFEPGQDVLPLIAEALYLLPPQRRWEVTFSTYFTGLPQAVGCTWRCMLAGSAEAHQSLRFVKALRIDLTSASIGLATGGSLVQAARGAVRPAGGSSRKPPALPVGHGANTDDDSDTAPDDGDAEYDLVGADNEAPPLPLGNVFHPHDKRRRRQGEKHNSADAEGNGGGGRRRWIILGIAITALLVVGSGIGLIAMQRRGMRSLVGGKYPEHKQPVDKSSKQEPGKTTREASASKTAPKKKSSSKPASTDGASVGPPEKASEKDTVASSPGSKATASKPASQSIEVAKDKPISKSLTPEKKPSTPVPSTTQTSDSKEQPSSLRSVSLKTTENGKTLLLEQSAATNPFLEVMLWSPAKTFLVLKPKPQSPDRIEYQLFEKDNQNSFATISSESSDAADTKEGSKPYRLILSTTTASDKFSRLQWCEVSVKTSDNVDHPIRIAFHPFGSSKATVNRQVVMEGGGKQDLAVRWPLGITADLGHTPEFRIEELTLEINAQKCKFDPSKSPKGGSDQTEIELSSNDLSVLIDNAFADSSPKDRSNVGKVKFRITGGTNGSSKATPVELTIAFANWIAVRSTIHSERNAELKRLIGSYKAVMKSSENLLKDKPRESKQNDLSADEGLDAQASRLIEQLQGRLDDLSNPQTLKPQSATRQNQLTEAVKKLTAVKTSLEGVIKKVTGLEEFDASLKSATVTSASVYYEVSTKPGGPSEKIYVVQIPSKTP